MTKVIFKENKHQPNFVEITLNMRIVICFFLLMFFLSTSAQNKLIPSVDKSGLDMSFFPSNYPILKIQGKATTPLIMRVIYSRPLKNGRDVFGSLVEYGDIWRLGANEATEIEFFRDVKIGNTKVKKGRYTLYAIPTIEKWTIILNKENDTWGSFKYDKLKDILRTDVKTEKISETVEAFSMYFEKTNKGAELIIMWDDVKASLPIEF